jgi:hypothetical protein
MVARSEILCRSRLPVQLVGPQLITQLLESLIAGPWVQPFVNAGQVTLGHATTGQAAWQELSAE